MTKKSVPTQPAEAQPIAEVVKDKKSKKSKKDKKDKKESKIAPISQRPMDLVWSFWFFNFLFFVMFTDFHNFTASYLGVEITALENHNLSWPPRFLTDIYFKWARTVDPLLYLNPIWWQCIEWVNLLCLMPMSIVGIIGFIKGFNWMRMPMVVVNSFTLYSVIVCMGSTYFGTEKTLDPVMFFWIYIPFFVMPACLIWRMWEEKPFNKKTESTGRVIGNFISNSIFIFTFVMFFYYVFVWFRRYTNYLDVFFGSLDYPNFEPKLEL